MAENLSDDTNEIRDEKEHHHHYGMKFPGMMCPYLAGGNVPTGMYASYPTENMDNMMHHHEELIETIQECEATCEHMMHMAIEKNDVHMRIRQLKLLHDCADVCTLMVKYLARHSIFSKHFANFCASVCEICGNECAKFHDEESQHCAHICLDCARKCKEFSMSIM